MDTLKKLILSIAISGGTCLAEGGKTTQGQIVSWLCSTLLILAIIFVLAYLLKKTRLVKSHSGKLTIENQLYISPKQKILLINAGSRKILVGVTAQNISYLTDYTDEKSDFDLELMDAAGSNLSKGKTDKDDAK